MSWGFAVSRVSRDMMLHPQLEATPDISRGEQRLAAEAVTLSMMGWPVPDDVMSRARSTLQVLAKG